MSVPKLMEDIESLRESLIDSEVRRIELLAPEVLAMEYISLKSEQLASLGKKELVAYVQAKMHGLTNQTIE